MAFQIDEAHLPAILTVGPMTDEAFAELCDAHPDLNLELSAQGELIVMPQTFTLTGARNHEISGQLWNWTRQDQRGVAFDSSTGWKLPNGARRSPDAAWIFKHRIRNLDPASVGGYWHTCPDFVIELRSQTDRVRFLREKMVEWLANGAQLGWLIDPESRTVEIYRPGAEPETRAGMSTLTGEGPVEGFVLELGPVWDPLGG
ncbi:MAG: Uma2 family endonuclease [Bryobacteraceae bacterium]|nr:Uma2 family endonuclease [Bryobacteraceae bacterium]